MANLNTRPAKPFIAAFWQLDFAYHKGKVLKQEIDRFTRVADECNSIRRAGAAALDLALVADGVF